MATTRGDAMATLNAGQEELDALFDQLSHDELAAPNAFGEWAPKDLMGHIAYWEELALKALDRGRAGLPPLSEELEMNERNARAQAELAPLAPAQIRERAASVHAALISALETVSDAEWSAVVAEGETLGEVLGGLTGETGKPFGHAWAHVNDLRGFVEARR